MLLTVDTLYGLLDKFYDSWYEFFYSMIKEIFYIMNMSILKVYYLINECIILVTKLSFVIITIIIKIVKV